MQTYGHVGAVAPHERDRPTNGHTSVPAAGRRKIIEALTGQRWTATEIAEAMGIAQAVIDADILDLPPAPPEPTPMTASEEYLAERTAEEVAFDQGWDSTEGHSTDGIVVEWPLADDVVLVLAPRQSVQLHKPHSVALLEAFAAHPGGLTAREAASIAGIDPYAASKRVPDLRKNGYIQWAGGTSRTYREGTSSVVYVTAQKGHDRLRDRAQYLTTAEASDGTPEH